MSTPEDIEAEIEQQREQLAETVDALTAKLDVKAQARAKADQFKDRVTTDDGQPRPEVIGGAVGVIVVMGLLVWWRRQ